MKNNILTIMKKEFSRFFGDKRMVLTTVLLPGLMIYIIYSFMGEGMMKEFMTDDGYVPTIYSVNMPVELQGVFSQMEAQWKPVEEAQVEDCKQQVSDKTADALLVFPEDFMEKVAAYDVTQGETAPEIEVYYLSTESESDAAVDTITELLTAYEDSLSNKFDINRETRQYDLASVKDMTGQIFAMLLPMLLMIFLYSGCAAIAPESIAGEKERGTIATLLVTPMKRSSLAIGKILSLSCIALLSGLSSFLGTMLSLPKLMGGTMSGMDAGVYGVTDYLMLLGIILSTVLIFVSIIAIISANSKSVKEAGTAVSPLMILVMVLSLVPMFQSEAVKGLGSYFIPLYNSVQCMHGIFSFQYEPVQVLCTIAVNLVAAVILVGILEKMFNSEKIMFAK